MIQRSNFYEFSIIYPIIPNQLWKKKADDFSAEFRFIHIDEYLFSFYLKYLI